MTGGKSPVGYLTAYLTNLYLSADSEKVQEAIEAGLNWLSFVISPLSLLQNESIVCLSQKVVLLHQMQKVTTLCGANLPLIFT